MKKPPKILTQILSRFLKDNDNEEILGDFEEKYSVITESKGAFLGWLWYFFQIILSLPRYLKIKVTWSNIMLKNYLKIAFRYLKRNKIYSTINITGLAIGFVCSFFIFLWISDELNYDKFHMNADRIYRVVSKGKFYGSSYKGARSPFYLAGALENDYPEIEKAVRFRLDNNPVVELNNTTFVENNLIYSDPDFFNVFDITLLKGDPVNSLSQPGSVIISENLAKKYFKNINVLNNVINVNGREFKITGIAKSFPQNSHFHFDLIAAISTIEKSVVKHWLNNEYYTYFVLRERADINELNGKIPGLIKKYVGNDILDRLGLTLSEFLDSGNDWAYEMQKMTDIHLHSNISLEIEPNGNIQSIYIFSVIGIFLLVIACINFVILTTAQSGIRVKEIGLRKIIGSRRSQLIYQFLMESVLLSFIAAVFMVIMVIVFSPLINNLSDKQLNPGFFSNSVSLIWFILSVIFIGIIAGIYPALIISSFKPANIIKGSLIKNIKGKSFKNALVILQFVISIILIISTIVVFKQQQYIQRKNLGFNEENILVLRNADALNRQNSAFKAEILKNNSVLSASFSHLIPGSRSYAGRGVYSADLSPDESRLLNGVLTDYDFHKTYRTELIEGRYFSKEFSSDTSNAMVLNESAVEAFGFTNPLGRILKLPEPQHDIPYTIIGVIKDFNYQSLHHQIEPMYFACQNLSARHLSYLSIRVKSDNIDETISFLEKTWKEFLPNNVFDYFFLNDQLNSLYNAEQRIQILLLYFSIIAITVSSFGLFAISLFISNQRKKEIGIRKVLGAKVQNIVLLLNKDYIYMILTANLIGWPISFYFMNKWLQNFAYKISISVWIFVVSAFFSLFIALITVSFQTIQTASTNPVDTLRNE